jgi:hypothetical protein
MAEAVFRYYHAGMSLVEGVTVSFWEESAPEPMFLIAHIKYRSDPDTNTPGDELTPTKGLCKEWDIWNLFFAWGEPTSGSVLVYKDVDGGRIESARLIGAPLFSIASIEVVVQLEDRLRAPLPTEG